MWEANDCKCAYTGKPLPKGEMVVDHVLPEVLDQAKRQAESAQLLRTLGLPADFDLHALTNFVPTFNTFNRQKGDNIGGLWMPHIRTGLRLAEANAAKVEALWKQFDCTEEFERRIANVTEKYGEHVPRRRIEEIINERLLGIEPVFKRAEEYKEGHAVIGSDRVFLFCSAPTFPDYVGSLLLRFKRLEVSICAPVCGPSTYSPEKLCDTPSIA